MRSNNKNHALRNESFEGIRRGALVSANRFSINPNRPYIVKNLLLAGQVGMIAGEPNLGKSAIMSCIASHVAMGRNMGSMKVKRAAVLYVAAEDPEGILERAYPFMHSAPDGAASFEVLDYAPDLTSEEEVHSFTDLACQFKARHEAENLLIIFDTLNLSIGDADENSARDMSKVFRNAQYIAKETGAHVLFIHHVGTSDKGRPRGSSAMTATLDTLLTLERAEDASGTVAMLNQKKQKRIRKGDSLAFRISSFEAGYDDDGELFTVPMAVPLKRDESLIDSQPVTAKQHQKSQAPGARLAEVLDRLKALAAHDGGKWHSRIEIGKLVSGPFNDVRDNRDTLRKAVARALDDLVKEKYVEHDGSGNYRYRAQSGEPDGSRGANQATLH
ncbi:AAA family ATPase [Tritonibacter mobilis]|uniref:AAA family ATPase n=1 Tax=Tritonibacter mobilis TaxID=379347 RepID=UPI001403C24C|nr:AAA family ATPase [Tritonibacter mobilis]NHM18011.1 AAA family ATPase [Tritonibacter mobilis]NHM22110.1 AAA family ATPase [Tritonibacter mobilis]